MDFIKSWKFAVIVFVVIASFAIVGVIYGVATHTEPGLMEDAPQWRPTDFPLATCQRAYVSGATTGIDVQKAIQTINSRLGFQAFVSSDSSCRVDITLGVPAEMGWMDPGGDARFTDSMNTMRCEVRTSNVQGELLGLVLQHELGHCLGLAHDDYEQSIMRRVQNHTVRGLPPWISDSDKSLLVGLYGPR
jgi:predicted Zn-dependent protease